MSFKKKIQIEQQINLCWQARIFVFLLLFKSQQNTCFSLDIIIEVYRKHLPIATRWRSYIVGLVDRKRRNFFHIQSVDVLLKEPKQGKVESGQPCLLTLKKPRTFLESTHRQRPGAAGAGNTNL